MLETEASFGEDHLDSPPPMPAVDVRGSAPNLAIRRRIERMRELKSLRDLLDDPDFDDLN